MFSTLESSWDRCAHRGWTTLASFTMQALALSLLLAIPLIWVQGPPRVHWLETISAPASLPPAVAAAVHNGNMNPAVSHHDATAINVPRPFSFHPTSDEGSSVPSAPEIGAIGLSPDLGRGAPILHGLGDGVSPVIPKPPAPTKPLQVSQWAEGNIIYRVQPIYPPLAKQARVQGTVELRAIISKTGAIENLVVVRGHPMLSGAAIEAVRQWRYRPYLLNNDPIEVETEITVNFILSGG